MTTALNVISFDVPYPANYGGVIDVFHKLRWLKKSGVSVVLHCFSYGREESKELEALCEKVYYYKRRTGLSAALSKLPYTVASRNSKDLLRNLQANPYPVLFEVLHTCYFLPAKELSARRKIYRHSNIEHDYYRHLSRTEKNPVKKLYLLLESWKLARFEKVVRHADMILAVNKEDHSYFRKKYPDVPAMYVPSFHPYDEVDIREGKGSYLLFQGNLGVSENYESALWLIEHVFSQLVFPVVIAGLRPPSFLTRKASKFRHIKVVANPTALEMDDLIAGAQVHCLHTHQPTGLKLKLLHVLFRGRFMVTNNAMLEGTGLQGHPSIVSVDTPNEYVSAVNRLFLQQFSEQEKIARISAIAPFRNETNVKLLLSAISVKPGKCHTSTSGIVSEWRTTSMVVPNRTSFSPRCPCFPMMSKSHAVSFTMVGISCFAEPKPRRTSTCNPDPSSCRL
jgi:hypothetical protein